MKTHKIVEKAEQSNTELRTEKKRLQKKNNIIEQKNEKHPKLKKANRKNKRERL
ncbi:hypothetical protein HYE08_01510 [Mycoplasmopsis bovis]|nr:hypothetical protein [Mycoplasmopsis bovis]QQH27051.1 hypothetical protein HYE08_01510 [Mycoplasmopsis bovis]